MSRAMGGLAAGRAGACRDPGPLVLAPAMPLPELLRGGAALDPTGAAAAATAAAAGGGDGVPDPLLGAGARGRDLAA